MWFDTQAVDQGKEHPDLNCNSYEVIYVVY